MNGSPPLKNLRMFEELCGKNALQNVILATTMWDEVDEETGMEREENLKSTYWQPMLDRNSRTSRFMRTRESAFTLIDPLIIAANKRNLDLLQQEMSEMRKKLSATSNGQEIFLTIEELVKQREDLLSRIRTELKSGDDDKTTLKLASLQKELLALQIGLEWTVKEMRRLKLPLGRRLGNMTDEFSKFTLKVLHSMITKVSCDQLTSPSSSQSHASYIRPHLLDQLLLFRLH